jgi:hypothetical protein
LEENLYGSENGWHQELFRRNEPRDDEGERPVSSQSSGLTNRLVTCTKGIRDLRSVHHPAKTRLGAEVPHTQVVDRDVKRQQINGKIQKRACRKSMAIS